MGIELEFIVLLIIMTLGTSLFAVFEVETPAWRKITKWAMVHAITIGLFFLAGHWALLFPVGAAGAGATFHYVWCRRNGIHPRLATPRRRYYELRGWHWYD